MSDTIITNGKTYVNVKDADEMPSCWFTEGEVAQLAINEENFSNKEKVFELLSDTSLVPCPSRYLERALAVGEPYKTQFKRAGAEMRVKGKDPSDATVLANSPLEKVRFRKRSGEAREVSNILYALLPLETRDLVFSRVVETTQFSGGVQHTLGRLAEMGTSDVTYVDGKKITLRVISDGEAAGAANASGVPKLSFTARSRPRLYPSVTVEDAIRLNVDADAGFPTGGCFRDTEVKDVTDSILQEFDFKMGRCPDFDTKLRVLEEWRRSEPLKFLFKGKAKNADPMKRSKILAGKARFINVCPQWAKIAMMRGTQALEMDCRNVLQSPASVRTFKGATIAHGGAMALDMILDNRAHRDAYAYTTTGDDTKTLWYLLDGTAMLSLDVTIFDLMQRLRMKLAILAYLRDSLKQYDESAAALWWMLSLMREVTIAGECTVEMTDGGPSGMPLQSLVNDMIMNVFMSRLVSLAKAELGVSDLSDERRTFNCSRAHFDAWVPNAIERVGATMCFEARVDEKLLSHALTMRGALVKSSLLYVGYNFYTRADGLVLPFIDLPRAMAQWVYPNTSYTREKARFKISEWIRLGATMLGWGVPPTHLAPSVAAAALLIQGKLRGLTDEALPELNESAFAGVDLPRTIHGLARALTDLSSTYMPPKLGSETTGHYNSPWSWLASRFGVAPAVLRTFRSPFRDEAGEDVDAFGDRDTDDWAENVHRFPTVVLPDVDYPRYEMHLRAYPVGKTGVDDESIHTLVSGYAKTMSVSDLKQAVYRIESRGRGLIPTEVTKATFGKRTDTLHFKPGAESRIKPANYPQGGKPRDALNADAQFDTKHLAPGGIRNPDWAGDDDRDDEADDEPERPRAAYDDEDNSDDEAYKRWDDRESRHSEEEDEDELDAIALRGRTNQVQFEGDFEGTTY